MSAPSLPPIPIGHGLYDPFLPDSSEQVLISSVALLKMLVHAKQGVPMEVTGILLGKLVDDYTLRVVDVIAMPQLAARASKEALDDEHCCKMMSMLKQTDRYEDLVGWYRSGPADDCWLSETDVNTHWCFQSWNSAAIAIVIDPIQSVRGKVLIDAFRMRGQEESREDTSNIGFLNKPCLKAIVEGRKLDYYSIAISYRKTDLEEQMLMRMGRKHWSAGFTLCRFCDLTESNEKGVEDMLELLVEYNKQVQEESDVSPGKLTLARVGEINAKKRLEDLVSSLMTSNIFQILGMTVARLAFSSEF